MQSQRASNRVLPLMFLGLLPVLVVALWVVSGRETLTKPFKFVQIQQRDELFGDVTPVNQEVRGPILGYFIGLDAVVLTTAFTGVASGVVLWLTGRRKTASHVERRVA